MGCGAFVQWCRASTGVLGDAELGCESTTTTADDDATTRQSPTRSPALCGWPVASIRVLRLHKRLYSLHSLVE